jgi:hypothetical protein
MKFIFVVLCLLSLNAFAAGSNYEVVFTGAATDSTADLAKELACSQAMTNASCANGLEPSWLPSGPSALEACLKTAYCLNIREPNIPYSADEFVCSASVRAVCRQ